MLIEGKIVRVKESLPARLTVESSGRNYSFILGERTRMVHQGKQIDFSYLKTYQKVLISVGDSNTQTMTPDFIHLIG